MSGAPRLILTVLIVLVAFTAWAGETGSNEPTPKADGRKWRLGYLEGGPSPEYVQNLQALVQALAEHGWLERTELPVLADPEDAVGLWRWLAANARGCCLEFAEDACYSSNWDDKKRIQTRQTVVSRLSGRRDVDLMIAMGTWAGQDLAAPDVSAPTEVMAASQPLAAKIVASPDDSGRDHLHARIDPDQYLRQIRLFHDIVGFKRLGFVYEDTLYGRSYAAVSDLEKAAAEMGFELVPCVAALDVPDAAQARQNLLSCHRQLVERQADAVYLTSNRAMRPANMAAVLAPLMAAELPTFSQTGSQEVRYGALLSFSQTDLKYVADFHARSLARMLSGTLPRRLPMLFEAPPNIAINLKAAEVIGFDPPFEVLMGADEIYKDIQAAP